MQVASFMQGLFRSPSWHGSFRLQSGPHIPSLHWHLKIIFYLKKELNLIFVILTWTSLSYWYKCQVHRTQYSASSTRQYQFRKSFQWSLCRCSCTQSQRSDRYIVHYSCMAQRRIRWCCSRNIFHRSPPCTRRSALARQLDKFHRSCTSQQCSRRSRRGLLGSLRDMCR